MLTPEDRSAVSAAYWERQTRAPLVIAVLNAARNTLDLQHHPAISDLLTCATDLWQRDDIYRPSWSASLDMLAELAADLKPGPLGSPGWSAASLVEAVTCDDGVDRIAEVLDALERKQAERLLAAVRAAG